MFFLLTNKLIYIALKSDVQNKGTELIDSNRYKQSSLACLLWWLRVITLILSKNNRFNEVVILNINKTTKWIRKHALLIYLIVWVQWQVLFVYLDSPITIYLLKGRALWDLIRKWAVLAECPHLKWMLCIIWSPHWTCWSATRNSFCSTLYNI